MRILVFILLFTFLNCSVYGQEIGVWSLQSEQYSDSLNMVSPNGQYRLRAIQDGEVPAIELLRGHRSVFLRQVYSLSEISWSPNSQMFCITESEGGQIGQWSVSVYHINDGLVKRLEVTRELSRDFRKKMRSWCPDDEPNYVLGGWVDNGNSILVVGIVPNHSVCPAMGRTFGYLVSARSGKILPSYSEESLKKTWRTILGPNLA